MKTAQRLILGFIAISTLALNWTAQSALFTGSASRGGNTCTNETYLYDTGNGLDGTVLRQECAAALQLGTLSTNGTFTAPPGTPVIRPNNGAYRLWCFTNVVVQVDDSLGNSCVVTQRVYVAQDRVGANLVAAVENILNQDWINSAGACLSGAGRGAQGFWNPGWRRPAVRILTTGFTNNITTNVLRTFRATLSSPDATSPRQLQMVHESLSGVSFIPAATARELNLEIVTEVNLAEADPLAFHALDFAGLNPSGQTIFTGVQLFIDLELGAGPQRGLALLLEDERFNFGIIGGNFLDHRYVYVNGSPQGDDQDTLGYSSAAGDLDGDAQPDVVLQSVDGDIAAWLLDGINIREGRIITRLADPAWRIRGTGDFGGTPDNDIVLQHPDGSVAFWIMNDTTVQGGQVEYNLPEGWRIAGVADFNADGHSDIVLQNETLVAFWLMVDRTIIEGLIAYELPPGWQIVATGDFNPDMHADIVLQHNDGSVAFWLMSGTTVMEGEVPYQLPEWKVAAGADFNRDGRTDLLLVHPDGTIAYWLMQGTAVAEGLIAPYSLDAAWMIP